MLMALVKKGAETDSKEKWFWVDYRYTESKPELIQKLKKPGTFAAMKLPAPNPFVPKELNLVE